MAANNGRNKIYFRKRYGLCLNENFLRLLLPLDSAV